MSDYTAAQQKFHLIAGTLLSAKIFSEYAFLLEDEYKHSIKGETTKKNRIIEAMAKTERLISVLSNDLKNIGIEIGSIDEQVENLEKVLYAVLTLSDEDQNRVMGLINKIKKQKELIEQ